MSRTTQSDCFLSLITAWRCLILQVWFSNRRARWRKQMGSQQIAAFNGLYPMGHTVPSSPYMLPEPTYNHLQAQPDSIWHRPTPQTVAPSLHQNLNQALKPELMYPGIMDPYCIPNTSQVSLRSVSYFLRLATSL